MHLKSHMPFLPPTVVILPNRPSRRTTHLNFFLGGGKRMEAKMSRLMSHEKSVPAVSGIYVINFPGLFAYLGQKFELRVLQRRYHLKTIPFTLDIALLLHYLPTYLFLLRRQCSIVPTPGLCSCPRLQVHFKG